MIVNFIKHFFLLCVLIGLITSLALLYSRLIQSRYQRRQAIEENNLIRQTLKNDYKPQTSHLKFWYSKERKFNYLASSNGMYPRVAWISSPEDKDKDQNKDDVFSASKIKIPDIFLPDYGNLYRAIHNINPDDYNQVKKKFEQIPMSKRGRISLMVFSNHSHSDINVSFRNQYALFLSHASKKQDLPLLKKLLRLSIDRISKFYLEKAIQRLEKRDAPKNK